MLRRMWHALIVGHQWREHSRQAFQGTMKVPHEIEAEYQRLQVYGFTDIDFVCDCGAHRRTRLIGQRVKAAVPDKELEQLRKMIE